MKPLLVSFSVALALFLVFQVTKPLPVSSAASKPGVLTRFSFSQQLKLQGTPVRAYDAFTKEVSRWWPRSHTHSKKPVAIVMEARPGGRFFEQFDRAGNGAIFGRVLFAHRGKRLTYSGPMAFYQLPVQMVHTLTFQAEGPQHTKLTLTVKARGTFRKGWDKIIARVWRRDFLPALQKYLASRKGKTKPRPASR